MAIRSHTIGLGAAIRQLQEKPKRYQPQRTLRMDFEAGYNAGLRGASISSCFYPPPRLQVWEEGWRKGRTERDRRES